MAGQKSNAITYVFEGDTLSLQQAIKRVSSLLTSSSKKLKKYQDGALTKDQEEKLKATKLLLRRLRAAAKEESNLDEQKKKRTLVAGREALRQARTFAKQATNIELKAARAEAAEKERLLELSTTAQQEAARQRASLLDEYADRLKNVLSEDAYFEITQAVREYNATMAESGPFTAEQADATDRLNETYKKYAKTLGTAVRAQTEAHRSIRNFGDVVKQTQTHIQEMLSSISFWLQLLRKTIQILKEGVSNAADYAESINYLAVVSGEANEELERFIKLQERAFGSDPTQLRTTAALFYQVGNSLDWSDEQALMLSKTFTQLAQDMASLQNVDLETATQKLLAGLTGQSRALKVWGIDVQDATVEQWLMTQGINASMESMNEASQMAARYAYILNRTTNAHGDLARTLDSPANQFKILNTQMQLLFQNLGALVIPTVTAFVKVINGVLQPVNAFLQAFTAASTTGFTSAIGEGSDALTELTDDAKTAEAAMVGLTGLDEINQADGGTGIGKAFAEDASAVDASIAELLSGYDNLAEDGNRLAEVFGSLGEALAPVWDILSSSPIDFADGLNLVGDALEYVLTPVEDLSEFLQSIFNSLPSWLQDAVGGFFQIAAAITAAVAVFSIFKTLSGSGVFKIFLTVLGGMVKQFISLTASIIKATAALIKNIAKTIWSTTVNWWNNASLAAKIGLLTMGAGLLIVGGVLAASAIMSNKANETGANAGGVPAMATGGVVTRPTLALVGEGSYDEAVMPLGNSPQFRAMRQSIAAETAQRVSRTPTTNSPNSFNSSARSGTTTRPIVLQLNGKEMARALLPEMGFTQSQTGVKLK